MRAPPWYKRCPADWQKGTRRFAMSFELRGFYSECLDAQWELQGQLPKDAKQLAMMLGTNARMVRALMPKLIALGKIIETETGYYNPRMMSDILGSEDALTAPEFKPLQTSNQPPIEREPISNRARTDLQSSAKIPKSPTNTTRDLDTDTDTEREAQSRASAPAAATPLPDRMTDRMIEAAGPCLANPVNCQGLLTEATPLMWIEQGCDFERDILPTLRAAAQSRKGKQISSWSYFTNMIAEAKAKRLAGLPTVSIGKPKSVYTPTPRRKTEDELYEENLAWAKKMGLLDDHVAN